MKRYINILMVALATMMTSCLTEDPRDQLYEEDIYNNANNIYINQWLCSTITLVAVQTVRVYRGPVVGFMTITHLLQTKP